MRNDETDDNAKAEKKLYRAVATTLSKRQWKAVGCYADTSTIPLLHMQLLMTHCLITSCFKDLISGSL
jgi:hypothetical protein